MGAASVQLLSAHARPLHNCCTAAAAVKAVIAIIVTVFMRAIVVVFVSVQHAVIGTISFEILLENNAQNNE